jgi:hypothetical protein
MPYPNPIPSGSQLEAQQQKDKPASAPQLPNAWSASVLLTPFGDSTAPLRNSSQLVVARIESATVGAQSWMRVKLYLTQDLTFFDFLFVSVDGPGQSFESDWYWVDSSTSTIYGPFETSLLVPGPNFLADNAAAWGNRYPLMCTDTNTNGIDCDHWMVPTPGTSDHGSWYAFRRGTENLFRILTIDSTNPVRIPVLGAYFMANVASFQTGISQASNQLVGAVIAGRSVSRPGYWNPMVTQEDIQRALAYPLVAGRCTIEDIQQILPGFAYAPPGTPLPTWTNNTYIEGWALAVDLIPYFTRVCYMWTGDQNSREQAIFIGMGASPGGGSYLKRTDTCLSTIQTDITHFDWVEKPEPWEAQETLPALSGFGMPFPDWIARSGGVIMGQIRGNPDFGLTPDQTLNLIAAKYSPGGGELAIFWAWFLASGAGMLFSEGRYLNPLTHVLQLVDYKLFLRDAPVIASDFPVPRSSAKTQTPDPLANVTRRANLHGGRARRPSYRT